MRMIDGDRKCFANYVALHSFNMKKKLTLFLHYIFAFIEFRFYVSVTVHYLQTLGVLRHSLSFSLSLTHKLKRRAVYVAGCHSSSLIAEALKAQGVVGSLVNQGNFDRAFNFSFCLSCILPSLCFMLLYILKQTQPLSLSLLHLSASPHTWPCHISCLISPK